MRKNFADSRLRVKVILLCIIFVDSIVNFVVIANVLFRVFVMHFISINDNSLNIGSIREERRRGSIERSHDNSALMGSLSIGT